MHLVTVKSYFVVMFAGLALASGAAAPDSNIQPLPLNETDSAAARWLDKPVLGSRLLDDMESLTNWVHHGYGEMGLTQERSQDGSQSIRLTSPTWPPNPGKPNGRPFGEASVQRVFPGENWTDFNRLSVWVYPTLPGFKVISLLIKLHNDGETKVPDEYGREGLDYILLKPNQWNHVVWEIAHLARDHVTGVSLVYRLQGNEPGATTRVCFDFDRLELQRVRPDYYEGWPVAPGRIAFSHTGYTPGSRKTALASGLNALKFQVVRQDSAKVAAEDLIRNLTTRNGTFQEMNFSEVREPGPYVIRVGDQVSQPFNIGDHVWRETLWKALNFFFCERCGFAVPGIHGVCHQDWQATHAGRTIVINGGWHDAGDLSQGAVNTAEAVYAMLSAAEHIQLTDAQWQSDRAIGELITQPSTDASDQARSRRQTASKKQPAARGNSDDAALCQRLLSEAQWGLRWLLNTRFGDGYRVTWATMDYWTDDIVGTRDDTFGDVRNSAFENYLAATAEAIAARMLKTHDPGLAAESLAAAEADWRFASEKAVSQNVELTSVALLAALELYKTTRQPDYAAKAIDLADSVMSCQEREIRDWTIPLSGFFYTDPRHQRLLHYTHRGHEQAPIVGLAELCAAFPDHPHWIAWYTAILLHSEYLQTLAKVTDPYGMLVSGVYRVDESSQPWFQNQLAAGVALDSLHCVRRFPAWTSFRGNCGTVLSQTKALSAASQLRRSLDLESLSQNQLQWVVGRNPFSQSLMYGEGYDYAPQYSAMSGDMVGSLPVGIETRADNDAPYWPPANCYNYKEVWVHPASRWIWLMNDLDGPGSVYGTAVLNDIDRVEIRERQTGRRFTLKPDRDTAHFAAQLSEGDYLVSQGKRQQAIRVLPGSRITLDLGYPLNITATQTTARDGTVTVKLALLGEGQHRLTWRVSNVAGDWVDRTIDLMADQPQTLQWHGKMSALTGMWVAVIIPDNHLDRRLELFGSARLR